MNAYRLVSTLAAGGLTASLVLLAPPAQANTEMVWTGDGDGNSWSDASNWTPANVPDTQSESARIQEGQVYVDGSYDVNSVYLGGTGALIDDGGGQVTATSFEMASGRLDLPVTAASFRFTGPDDKEVSNNGSINATLVRGGNQGEVLAAGGTVLLNTSGTNKSGNKSIRAKASLTIAARIDGRGANNATIDIDDAACNVATSPYVCGIIVDAPANSYGPAIEGVTVVSSNITFQNSSTLSLREGAWKPRTGGRVRSVNNATALLETGGPYPPGEPGTPGQEVSLPAALTLDGVTWQHVSGVVAGTGALSPGAASGTFTWSGGTIQGALTTKAVGTLGVALKLNGDPNSPLELDGPARGRASITIEAGGEMMDGTELVLDEVSAVTNKSPVATPFIQREGTVITGLTGGSSVTKVENTGVWVVDRSATDTKPATIESMPFRSTGNLTIRAGAALLLDSQTPGSVKNFTTFVNSSSEFGQIQVAEGSALALSGTLTATANPGATLASGDDMLIVDSLAEPGGSSGITGAFSPVVGSGLSSGLGFSGELIDVGYVLSVGAPEELALSAAPGGRARAKQPWTVTFTVSNRSAGQVSPTLSLTVPRGVTVTLPTGLTCTNVTAITRSCPLAPIAGAGQATVAVIYTFPKPGAVTLQAAVTSAGYNPKPAGATWTVKVPVGR